MPAGVAVVAIVTILAGCWTIASVVKHLFGRPRKRSSPESQLTTSELEGMIRRAVEEATRPLEEKIERLEQGLEAPSDDAVREMEERDYGLIDEMPEQWADADVPSSSKSSERA